MNAYIPNQHGAWAMLVVPFLAGMMAAGPDWLHLPLFVSWLLAYLLTFPLLQWVKSGKRKLYLKPVLLYGSLLAPVGAIVLWMMPSLLWWSAAIVPLFLMNCYYARRKQERTFANDAIAVLQFCLMTGIAYQAGGGTDAREVLPYAVGCFGYFMGTVFYVKTIIRERNNPRFYRMSVAYHSACVAAASLLLPLPIALASVVLLARAVLLPRRGISAKQSGMLEIGFALLVTITFFAL
jgi:hypothetical protein